MSSNERRRERYRSDPEYRRRRIAAATRRKAPENSSDKTRGWESLASVPENETVLLYDPEIFWPVLATWNSDTLDWDGIHYEGKIRPTHWRYPLRLPLS